MKMRMKSGIAIMAVGAAVISGFYAFSEVVELSRYPESGVVVIYKKRPFLAPRIELRRVDGTVLDSRVIERGRSAKYVEVHGDATGIVVLSGGQPWVWDDDLWMGGDGSKR